MKNVAAKTVARYGMSKEDILDAAYQVYQTADGSWTWAVVKMWQADDAKPYARWLCVTYSPWTPEGEWGDAYAAEIKRHGRLVRNRIPELLVEGAYE